MKQMILMVLIVALLVGCTAPAPQTGTESIPKAEMPVQADEPVREVAPVSPEPVVMESPPVVPEKCDTVIDPIKLSKVEYSFSEGGIDVDSDGFSFSFFPLDAKGNIMPIEGNIAVKLYWTEIDHTGKRKSKQVVYEMAKYIKPEDVNPDCSPKPVVVKYDNIIKDRRYEGVTADDPGFINVIFVRSGSFDEFTGEFMGDEENRMFP